MALYDIVWLCGNVHVHTEPLNTNEHETWPNLGFVLTLIPLRKKSALWAQIRLLADGAKEKETLESEDMDTRPEPENPEIHVGCEWSIESFYSCWFDTTQVGTGRLLLEMKMHLIDILYYIWLSLVIYFYTICI